MAEDFEEISAIEQRLDAKIPEDVVEQREQAGRLFSYLSGAYVINRLNDVLGHGKWSYSIERLEKVFEGKVSQRSGEVFATSYIATILLRAQIDGGPECFYEDVGYGDGTDRMNPGKAHELAVKESVTDGIKRAAKNLGLSMGLGLYFKDGEYITSASEEIVPNMADAPKGGKSAKGKMKGKSPGKSVGEQQAAPAGTLPTKTPPQAPKPGGNRQLTTDLIRAAYRVISSQNAISSDEFKTKYLEGKRMDELSDEALTNAYRQITHDYHQILS